MSAFRFVQCLESGPLYGGFESTPAGQRSRGVLSATSGLSFREVDFRLADTCTRRKRLGVHHLETLATILISVIPFVGISLATWIAVHAGNGALI